MAFEKRQPTEEEIKYLKSFEIRCPYEKKHTGKRRILFKSQ